MDIKRTFIGILSSLVIGSSCVTPITIPKSPAKIQKSFENNNISLEDKVLQETLQSVEIIETRATYNINLGHKNIKDSIGIRGSGTVIAENENHYFVLTANHVIELPETLISNSSTSSITGSIDKEYEKIKSTDSSSITTLSTMVIPNKKNYSPLEIGKKIQNVLSSTTTPPIPFIAKRGDINIKVGDIHGAEVVCSSEKLDYAILKIQNNGKLSSLTKNKNAYLGNTDIISRGDYVYAMGFPLGLGGLLLSDGIISSPTVPLSSSNSVTSYRDDAFMFTPSISHGNSGGPVFSVSDGNLYLIGVVSGYYKGGNDLNIAFKLNNILYDIKGKDCLNIKKENHKKLPKRYNKLLTPKTNK